MAQQKGFKRAGKVLKRQRRLVKAAKIANIKKLTRQGKPGKEKNEPKHE